MSDRADKCNPQKLSNETTLLQVPPVHSLGREGQPGSASSGRTSILANSNSFTFPRCTKAWPAWSASSNASAELRRQGPRTAGVT